MRDDLPPEVAAALTRGHNNWTRDFCAQDPAPLKFAAQIAFHDVGPAVGDDNIVVSTDYPHSDGLFPRAMEEFVHLEGVSDETKAKILWDNCARFYRL